MSLATGRWLAIFLPTPSRRTSTASKIICSFTTAQHRVRLRRTACIIEAKSWNFYSKRSRSWRVGRRRIRMHINERTFILLLLLSLLRLVYDCNDCYLTVWGVTDRASTCAPAIRDVSFLPARSPPIRSGRFNVFFISRLVLHSKFAWFIRSRITGPANAATPSVFICIYAGPFAVAADR